VKILLRFGYTKRILFLFASFFLTFGYSPIAKAVNPEPQQLIQQGKAYYEAGQFSAAIRSLEEAASLWKAESRWESLAITLTNLGRVQLAAGHSETALETWASAIALYQEYLSTNTTAIARIQLYRAHAFQELGFYAHACEDLVQSLNILPQLCDQRGLLAEDLAFLSSLSSTDTLQVLGWQALADVFQKMGRLEESQQILRSLLEQSLPESAQGTVKLSLGNTYQALGNRERDRAAPIQFNTLPWHCQPTKIPDTAQDYYQKALQQYQHTAQLASATDRTKAQLNGLTLLAQTGQPINHSFSQGLDLETLPVGRTRIYAQIRRAKTNACISQNHDEAPNWSVLQEEIHQAITNAQQLEDSHAESYAIGNLGSLYEYQAWWLTQNGFPQQAHQQQLKALKISDRALFLAQSVQATDSVYQWYWQRGRLLKALGKKTEAINAYESAVRALETVREDLVQIDSDVQFSFRDQVEPVYRELVGLLLDSIEPESSSELVQARLMQSLYYVESLQLVELENFLQCNFETAEGTFVTSLENQDDRVQALRNRLEHIFQDDPQAAFIYPVFLEDGIAVILKLPGQDFRYHVTPLKSDAQDFETVLDTLQTYLRSDPSRRNEIRELSGQIYQWLIQPFEDELETAKPREQSEVKRLIFVLDGALRNVPMTVLFNSKTEQYLLERYAIAIAPSLQLLNSQRPSTSLSALVAGLSEARDIRGQSFSALNNVPEELAAIESVIPSEKLLNETFVRSTINQQLENNPYSVLHAATHGNFSSDPNQTYLLLSDELLQVRELSELLNNDSTPLELLVLSACETATGDRRAALGLAGIALRAGAKSTLATLWQVDDESTAALMSEFYRELRANPSLPKAEALRNAQLRLWENSSQEWNLPFFWSPYVLVGNWL
jgi:CHAT domain-containing protein/predicted negative regulator of RcsB-dependent stress response